MTTQTLLHDLTARGVILLVNGNQLDVDGPDEALTDELLTTLRERKADLLELLTRPQLDTGPDENIEMHDSALGADEPAEVCPVCACELRERRGKQFRHLWCPTPGHFDAWRADGGRKLSDTEAPIIRERERTMFDSDALGGAV